MNSYFHSVTTNPKACKGCTNCIKYCPMEAIRVRSGVAEIIPERCIDCGECIRQCPSHAMIYIQDSLSVLEKKKYNVALVEPALIAQFHNLTDPDIVLTALLELGFDAVEEISIGHEIYAREAKKFIKNHQEHRPYISTTCPAVVRLVRTRYQTLVDHLLPIQSPMEISAAIALGKAMEKTGLSREEIGITHIAACPAQIAYSNEPLGLKKSRITANIGIKSIYPKLVVRMNALKGNVQKLSAKSAKGYGDRASGVNSILINENYIEATDIKSILKILDGLEDDEYTEYDFINLLMCTGGCLNGDLCVENHYAARASFRKISKNLVNEIKPNELPFVADVYWNKRIRFENVYQLGDSMKDSLNMLATIKRIESEFPGLDCGACGAPTCKALAEDIVRRKAFRKDCIYYTRKHIHELTKDINEFSVEISVSIGKDQLSHDQLIKLQDFINRLWIETNALDEKYRK